MKNFNDYEEMESIKFRTTNSERCLLVLSYVCSGALSVVLLVLAFT